MKLRMKGDSIRLRLTRNDVSSLVTQGRVEDCTRFPVGAPLGYAVVMDATAGAVGAAFDAGVITVHIPGADARAWARSEEVTIRAELPVASGVLLVLVEKDFPCTTPRAGADDREPLFGARRPVED